MKRIADQPRVIDITALTRIASGKQRNIFLLDQAIGNLDFSDVRIVLKVPKHSERHKRLPFYKKLLRKLYPASALRVIRKEAAYLARASQKFVGSPQLIPIPSFMGFVETSDGTGALWEAICDTQGQLAPTLEKLLAENQIADVFEPLNSFVETCMKNDLVITDLNPRNLVYGQKAGAKQFFIVDGFGDHRVISLREMFRKHNRSKLIQSFNKLSDQTGLMFDMQTNSFRHSKT